DPSAPPLFETPHDLSPWGMFIAADWVVKSVILTLLLASIVTWTVWLAKSIALVTEKRRLRAAFASLSGATCLKEAAPAPNRDAAAMMLAAEDETALVQDVAAPATPASAKERISLRIQRIEAAAIRRLGRGIGVLAIIGSTAPFVGLFGTVWGI